MCAARNPTTLPKSDPLRSKRRTAAQPSVVPRPVPLAMCLSPLVLEQVEDRRNCARLPLDLPVRLVRVAGRTELSPLPLKMHDISSSGAYLLAPMWIGAGTNIELEVGLVDQPLGRGALRMVSSARVVRSVRGNRPDWHWLAVAFDDISFSQREVYTPPDNGNGKGAGQSRGVLFGTSG